MQPTSESRKEKTQQGNLTLKVKTAKAIYKLSVKVLRLILFLIKIQLCF